MDCGFGVWIANQAFRLAGLDCPELGTDAGRAARDYVRGLLPVGTDVWIRTHLDQSDKYGRLLVTIWLDPARLGYDAVSVNQLVVAAGFARPYDGGAR